MNEREQSVVSLSITGGTLGALRSMTRIKSPQDSVLDPLSPSTKVPVFNPETVLVGSSRFSPTPSGEHNSNESSSEQKSLSKEAVLLSEPTEKELAALLEQAQNGKLHECAARLAALAIKSDPLLLIGLGGTIIDPINRELESRKSEFRLKLLLNDEDGKTVKIRLLLQRAGEETMDLIADLEKNGSTSQFRDRFRDVDVTINHKPSSNLPEAPSKEVLDKAFDRCANGEFDEPAVRMLARSFGKGGPVSFIRSMEELNSELRRRKSEFTLHGLLSEKGNSRFITLFLQKEGESTEEIIQDLQEKGEASRFQKRYQQLRFK